MDLFGHHEIYQWHIPCERTFPRGRQQRELIVEGRRTAVVLIVEDDEAMRSLLCDELWGDGYQLREAANGHEGLESILTTVPDLIVTDLKMPAGDLTISTGYGLLPRIAR